MSPVPPTNDDASELLLSCRYGDLDDVQQFVAKFGSEPLSDVRDDNRNTILHMVCANGHTDVLDFLLPLVPAALFRAQNSPAQSTPLHWAALNGHLPIVRRLVEYKSGPGIELIDIKNAAGITPLGEAEMAGWDEGAKWLVGVMKLDDVKEEEEDGPVDNAQDVEVEIEDADGQVAKMTISGGVQSPKERDPSDMDARREPVKP